MFKIIEEHGRKAKIMVTRHIPVKFRSPSCLGGALFTIITLAVRSIPVIQRRNELHRMLQLIQSLRTV